MKNFLKKCGLYKFALRVYSGIDEVLKNMVLKFEDYHWRRVERRYSSCKGKYYIICFSDPMKSGWTVWERVVLYNCILAEEKGMIPVVDMCNYPSIYHEKDDIGKINIWDRYYEQPGGVDLEMAISGKQYVYCDASPKWFAYIRNRKKIQGFSEENLRTYYQKYIRLNKETEMHLEDNYLKMISQVSNTGGELKLLGIRMRGTDYKLYHHPKQPKVVDMICLAKDVFEKYHCDYYYISTEDAKILEELKKHLPDKKVLSWHAGEIEDCSGYLGEKLAEEVGARKAALDYLQVLYNINKCSCLVGGVNGATIVAAYRRNPPYEYINIVDTHEIY